MMFSGKINPLFSRTSIWVSSINDHPLGLSWHTARLETLEVGNGGAEACLPGLEQVLVDANMSLL